MVLHKNSLAKVAATFYYVKFVWIEYSTYYVNVTFHMKIMRVSLMLMWILHSLTVETVSVGFEQTSYSASEDGPLNVRVCAEISNLLEDLECNLVVTFNAISNNTAGEVVHIFIQQCESLLQNVCVWPTVDGEDFTVSPPDVFEATFVAMSTSNGDTACDSITIIDDNVLEGEHSFEIQIVSTDPMLSNIDPASTVVTILDNEGNPFYTIVINYL